MLDSSTFHRRYLPRGLNGNETLLITQIENASVFGKPEFFANGIDDVQGGGGGKVTPPAIDEQLHKYYRHCSRGVKNSILIRMLRAEKFYFIWTELENIAILCKYKDHIFTVYARFSIRFKLMFTVFKSYTPKRCVTLISLNRLIGNVGSILNLSCYTGFDTTWKQLQDVILSIINRFLPFTQITRN